MARMQPISSRKPRWSWMLSGAIALAAGAVGLWCYLYHPVGTDAKGHLLGVYGEAPPVAHYLLGAGGVLASVTWVSHALAASLALGCLAVHGRRAMSLWPAVGALHLVVLWWVLPTSGAGAPGIEHDRIWSIVQVAGTAVVLAAALGVAVFYGVFAFRSAERRRRIAWEWRRSGLAVGYGVAGVAFLLGELLGPRGPWGPLLEPADYARQWLRAAGSVACTAGVFRYWWMTEPQRHFAWSGPKARAALGYVGIATLVVGAGVGTLWYEQPVERFHEVVPGTLYRSAQPSETALGILHSRVGFRTIVCMRSEGPPPWEQEFARRHGILLIDPHVDEWTPERLLAVVGDARLRPVLIHCSGGRNRTSSWVGLYRYLVEGWTLEEVYAEVEQITGRMIHPILPVFFADTLKAAAGNPRLLADQ